MKLLPVRMFVAVCVTVLAMGSLSSAYAGKCDVKVKDLEGEWSYSEQGTSANLNPLGSPPTVPWSEVGWFKIEKDGTAHGEVFISVGGVAMPSAEEIRQYGIHGIPMVLSNLEINPDTCIGAATFTVGGPPPLPPPQTRTSIFTITSDKEFSVISTSGDQTVLGVAKRRR